MLLRRVPQGASLTVCTILTFVAAEGEDGHHGGRSPFPCVCIFHNGGDKDGGPPFVAVLMAGDDETDNV